MFDTFKSEANTQESSKDGAMEEHGTITLVVRMDKVGGFMWEVILERRAIIGEVTSNSILTRWEKLMNMTSNSSTC